MVFDKVRSLFDSTQIQDFLGYEVSLESALTWIIRELRLHVQKEIIDLSLKLDAVSYTHLTLPTKRIV